MTIHDALNYEIRSCRWLILAQSDWLRNRVADYFEWKVNRKWARYQASIEARREVEELRGEMEELRAEMAKRRADLVR